MKKLLLVIFYSMYLNAGSSQTWSTVGDGLGTGGVFSNDAVFALELLNGNLFAGGTFDSTGNIPANNIAKWNGTTWSTVGNGFNGSVLALTVFNGELYAGGYFDSSGTNFVNHIAKWNGTNWVSVGTLPNVIYALAVYNGELYAGGLGLAKWNGTNWVTVLSGTIAAMFVYNAELYVGGGLLYSGIHTYNNIAKWNGTNWSDVGTGIHGSNGFASYAVTAFTSYNGNLCAGGTFDSAGNVPANNIAEWNGLTWSPLGAGVDGLPPTVWSLASYNGELYAGGEFDTAGSLIVYGIARWNGNSWNDLGGGLNYNTGGAADALKVYNNELYAGGYIFDAGGTFVNNIARWSLPLALEENNLSGEINIFPNPVKNNITVESSTQLSYFEFHDMTGKLLMRGVNSATWFSVDMSKFKKGIYFLTVGDQEKEIHRKVIKE